MKKHYCTVLFLCLVLLTAASVTGTAQNTYSHDSLLAAAHKIMQQTSYCGLVTVDANGQPQVRTMNPFPQNDEFVTWFATSRDSRKVTEIRNNPKVAVYFANHNEAKGYVSITGKAEIIDDKELLVKMKRDYWENIPGWQDIFVLIKIVPDELEVINYEMGINGTPGTSKAPSVKF